MTATPDFIWIYKPEKENDLRKHLPKFETSAEVEQRAKKLCRSLTSNRSEHKPEIRKLEGTIRQCQPGKRCGLIPCPKCRRRYRLWLTAAMLQLFEGQQELWFVTLVPPRRRYPPSELTDFKPKNLTERVRRQIERAQLTVIAVGSIDFSFEVDGRTNVKRRRPSAWQPHLHMIVTGCTKKELRKALERHYPSSKAVQRPLMIEKVAETAIDRMKACSYCTKPFFQERIRYHAGGKQCQRSVALKRPQLHEIALFAASQSYRDLQLRIGVRQYGSELRVFSTKNDRMARNRLLKLRKSELMPRMGDG